MSLLHFALAHACAACPPSVFSILLASTFQSPLFRSVDERIQAEEEKYARLFATIESCRGNCKEELEVGQLLHLSFHFFLVL